MMTKMVLDIQNAGDKRSAKKRMDMQTRRMLRKMALTSGFLAISAFLIISMAMQATGGMKADKDIVDTAVGAGSFNTLVTAVKAAGLVDTLKSDGPFTVFAPTDEAFAKLPEGTVEALLKDREKLTAILTYHVVPGKIMAKDVADLSMAQTANGQSLRIKAKNGEVMVDDAKVVQADIPCSNGVIHVIDTVVIPKTS
jgi:uncharacterized surface protein with fasciclin (FAS1) repeats